jgi:hypothetical protein
VLDYDRTSLRVQFEDVPTQLTPLYNTVDFTRPPATRYSDRAHSKTAAASEAVRNVGYFRIPSKIRIASITNALGCATIWSEVRLNSFTAAGPGYATKP